MLDPEQAARELAEKILKAAWNVSDLSQFDEAMVQRISALLLTRERAARLEERERCAKIAEETTIVLDDHPRWGFSITGKQVANAIRRAPAGDAGQP